MTIEEVYNDFKAELTKVYDQREADNIADWIFENITGLKRWERRNSGNEISENHLDKLNEYLKELLKHKPVQYVLNEAWFYKRKFFVDENVLIPRPETEELVEWIISDVKDKQNFEILDIGTGSGCIPVSLKKELRNANVTAIDVSENALFVARKNAKELDAEIDFKLIDFLHVEEWGALLKYDIIVSNPPYIPIAEKQILAKNVTDFEPGIALFVNNNDPYIFYEKIAGFAKLHLKEKGKIYVEVHDEYAKNVKEIFEKAGFISKIKKDIYGKERMVCAV
jgi:release factor glutamine methyltransferase